MASVVHKLGEKGTLKRAAEAILETVNNTKKQALFKTRPKS